MKIPASELLGMTDHWLSTPANGYLGDSYGSIVPDLLQQPLATGLPDTIINKLRTDIAIIGALPANQLGLYSSNTGPDEANVFISIQGQQIDVPGT